MIADHVIDVSDWEDFDLQIKGLRETYANWPLVFRGLGDSTWPLMTTLERYEPAEMSFVEYYRIIAKSESQIRAFAPTTWNDTPSYLEVRDTAVGYEQLHIQLSSGRLPGYGYMAHLRHLGFPSPLMDWTRSPYIAAFFAFRPAVKPAEEHVSIFVFCEMPQNTKGGGADEAEIHQLGPYVQTHRRHYLQQGEYTMCVRWDETQPWRFVSHQAVFDRNDATQDVLWRFNIPWTERVKVLKSLDEHNVNAFSLFDSDEALLETLALRTLTFKQ